MYVRIVQQILMRWYACTIDLVDVFVMMASRLVTSKCCYCCACGGAGPHNWPLGACRLPHPPGGVDVYKQFARALLDGAVCPPLAEHSQSLLSLPVTMVKSWAKYVE